MTSFEIQDVFPYLFIALAIMFILRDNRQSYALMAEKYNTTINVIEQRLTNLDKYQKSNSSDITKKFTDIDNKQKNIASEITKKFEEINEKIILLHNDIQENNDSRSVSSFGNILIDHIFIFPHGISFCK